jgi:hypothetical protein
MFESVLLYVHAFATWMMIGLIFFVQVVYFPLYKRLKDKFTPYDVKDIKHMGMLVAPVFFFEFLSAVILVFYKYHDSTYRILSFVNLLMLVSIWVVNYYLQVKRYGVKTLLFLDKMHHFLLTSNWYRTCVWFLRGLVVLAMLLFLESKL